MNFDGWIDGYKVKVFPWIDRKKHLRSAIKNTQRATAPQSARILENPIEEKRSTFTVF